MAFHLLHWLVMSHRLGRVLAVVTSLVATGLLGSAASAQGTGMQVLGIAGIGIPSRSDPLNNFDFLWKAFERDYAFFRERGVDWNAARDQYRSQLEPTSDPVRLYEVCRDMLESIGDDHVSLEVPAGIKDRASPGKGTPSVDFTPLQEAIVQRYVPGARTEHGGKIRWGSIDERVGYLQINTMEAFTSTSEGDVLAVRKVMDAVVRELARKELVILDIRFNGGGYDDVSFEIMSRFVDQRRVVLSRKIRKGAGFSRPEPAAVAPARNRLRCRVAILMSPETGSAAETLAIISLPFPHMTRIGSNTNGILSDMEEGKMPNGWTYSLSNMVVKSFDGTIYEVVGVPPVQAVDYPREASALYQQILDGLPAGDAAIDLALGRR